MNSVTNFDPCKFCLGKLCIKMHEYAQTGLTLRYIKGRNCVQCTLIRTKQYSQTEKGKEKQRKRSLLYSRTEKGKASRKRQQQSEARKKYLEVYAKSEARKVVVKKYQDSEKGKLTRRANARKRYHENREKYIAEGRRWKQNNPDWQQQYRQTEKGRSVAKRYEQQRRIILSLNHASAYSSDELMVRFQEFDNCCAYCGKKATSVDHVIAINCGGPDVISNLLPSCRSCNSSKGTKPVDTWYKSQSFFCPKRWKRILKVLGKTESTLTQLPLF